MSKVIFNRVALFSVFQLTLKFNPNLFHFRVQSQQLAKIYALLNENEEQHGRMSINDLKNQMSMYSQE